ncbi:TDG/mug DNA glycosylase family protein [Conyzicola lurida]|uniref:TDG/mug DNA glycosylase family protein n=1 Tax=Conyzicola lurida TaxID=1172621 RepID=A0A841ANB7_9MICO|nr:mismatch-specific DNA-glycosylase [Conyzicola lurida]MBB5843206.1 TDG/mug DNA glycosylase family protein [Conyzicola lurida]
MGYSAEEIAALYGRTLPDTVGPMVKLLFVGINPGLHTVAVQAPFALRGNRFYPALYRAGITDRVIDASAGLSDDDRRHLYDRGVGITSLVAAATRRADELTTEQLREGAVLLEARVAELQPRVVAMLGVTAYRVAFDRRKTAVGPQHDTLGGARLWVVPNPSGLNAHETAASLGAAYREAAVAAGVEVYDVPAMLG